MEAIVRRKFDDDTEVTASKAEGIVRFRTSANDEVLSELLKLIVNSGSVITQFRELVGDLEEAFISATQQSKTPEPVGAAE